MYASKTCTGQPSTGLTTNPALLKQYLTTISVHCQDMTTHKLAHPQQPKGSESVLKPAAVNDFLPCVAQHQPQHKYARISSLSSRKRVLAIWMKRLRLLSSAVTAPSLASHAPCGLPQQLRSSDRQADLV
jgi:hypothetical protein